MTPNISDSCFNTDQISKLRDLEKANIESGGIGFKAEFQELIARLESGGIKEKSIDPRIVQARKLWKKGWGRELKFKKFKKFEQFLATIPEIPASLLVDNPNLPLLVLVDPRLGHVKSANLAGLKYAEYGYTDKTLEPFDGRHNLGSDKPYWVRAHDGSPNLGRKPSVCRTECTGKLFAGTADVGIAIWIQYGPRKHVMDLPGSVCAGHREGCACVNPFDDPKLHASWVDVAVALCGAVVFVRE